MKLKRIALATALAALGLGFAGQASADVYAGSSLKIDQLLINFFAGDFNTTTKTGTSANANVDIRNFQFTLTNNAALNNVGAAPGTNTCFGTIASNNCNVGTPTLDAAATNAPGSAFNRVNNQTAGADNSFKWFGLGGGNWSNSDSVIYTSELTSAGANPTNTDQIAEANLSSGGSSASGSSLIKSQTGFTFNFTVGGDNPVQVFFDFPR
jgi:hypothetical protein